MAKLQKEPKTAEIELTAVLYALSDETRLTIVHKLTITEEIACGYFEIDMPKSSLSHHFRVLRSAGLVASRKEGTALMNRLRREDIDQRFPGLLDSILTSMSGKKKSKAKSAGRSATRVYMDTAKR